MSWRNQMQFFYIRIILNVVGVNTLSFQIKFTNAKWNFKIPCYVVTISMIPHRVNNKIHIFRTQKCNTPYVLYGFQKKEEFFGLFNVKTIIYEIEIIMSPLSKTIVLAAIALPLFSVGSNLCQMAQPNVHLFKYKSTCKYIYIYQIGTMP